MTFELDQAQRLVDETVSTMRDMAALFEAYPGQANDELVFELLKMAAELESINNTPVH